MVFFGIGDVLFNKDRICTVIEYYNKRQGLTAKISLYCFILSTSVLRKIKTKDIMLYPWKIEPNYISIEM